MTVEFIKEEKRSESSKISLFGALKLPKIFTPTPAELPGVYIVFLTFANFFTLDKSWPKDSIPFFHFSAVSLANSSMLKFLFCAAMGSIYGKKSEGLMFGKSKQRLPISPFGSITMAGILSIAASSIIPIPSPVFPDPVIPIIAA